MWRREDVVEETEWSRTYSRPDGTCVFYESKFLTNAESPFLSHVISRWQHWSDWEKVDFCQAFSCAPPQNALDIVRRIAIDQSPAVRSTIAQCVARLLPAEEAIATLASWLGSMSLGDTGNVIQAIALTNHPTATLLLQRHLAALLQHLAVTTNQNKTDDVAYDLLCCTEYLLQLGNRNPMLNDACQRLRCYPSDRIRHQVDRRLPTSFEADL